MEGASSQELSNSAASFLTILLDASVSVMLISRTFQSLPKYCFFLAMAFWLSSVACVFIADESICVLSPTHNAFLTSPFPRLQDTALQAATVATDQS